MFKGEMEVTPACYAHLLNSLLCLAGGKVAVILEVGVIDKRRGSDGKELKNLMLT
jgi:hypothetical protein